MAQEKKIVSIVIPVYNVEEYIQDCLNSIVKQNYKFIECILVDDCGTDNSMEVVETYIRNYNGQIVFRIIKHDRNQGLSVARNSGIEAAQGEYIYFLDSDDTITEDCIEYMISIASTYNYDVVMCSHSKSTEILKATDIFEKKYFDNNIYLLHNEPNNAWNRLIKLDIIKVNNLKFYPNIYHEDRLWSFLLIYYIKSAVVSNKVTYIYNVRPNSIMTDNTKAIKRIKDSLVIVEQMDGHLSDFAKNSFLQQKSIDYVNLERFSVCVYAYLSSHEFGKEIFGSVYKKIRINEYINLENANKIRCLSFLLPKKIGFLYFKLLCNTYYKNKIKDYN